MKHIIISRLLALLIAGPTASSSAAVFYTETFTDPTGTGSTNTKSFGAAYGTAADLDPSNDLAGGWAGYYTATAVSGTADNGRFLIADRQTPNGTIGDYGFGLLNGGTQGPAIAATTKGININSATTDLAFSFILGNASATDALRIAALVGGQWYVSVATFSTVAQGAGDFDNSPGSTGEVESLPFNPAAANWNLLTFVPGTTTSAIGGTGGGNGSLALGGTPGSNLSGSITGVGLFSAATTAGNVRFDTFQITGVPEASVSLSLLLGAGVLAGRRRR